MRILTTLAVVALLPMPALAQSSVEGRVGKLESEMRAVQRKVFPGGQLLQPDIAAPVQPTGTGPGSPASSAVIDLSGRVTSLEQQIATLTGQIEQNTYRNRQLQEQFDAYRRSTDARLTAIEGARAPATGAAGAAAGADTGDGGEPPVVVPPRATTPRGGAGVTRPAAAATTTPRGAADPARASRVAAVAKPASGDAAEDEYLYGYRLWQAKLYPEAQAQLKKVVADNPKGKRASYAQNLLGRAYLDEGKPSLASMAFYDNYKKLPDGERAPDSLLYLGQALVKLNKPADACKVYDELTDVYGAKLSAEMTAQVATGRTTAKCK